ncbi:hypothetical protein SGFS_081810 [Streptomyces graminofaciens]|uniref:Uncharacterized protein n=1 Tax=Streptomyces graminofaciens TaxID=68212 RepID=A0ABN5VY69_9ACTN|nr:hypothetical protein SGFS_081810 [Streptomyces graminofaciens]
MITLRPEGPVLLMALFIPMGLLTVITLDAFEDYLFPPLDRGGRRPEQSESG